MRVTAGVVGAAVVAFSASVVLGEYPVVGATPWVAAAVVPLAIAETAAVIGGRRPAWLWPMAALFSAAALAWGVWLSTGRGLDPWPTGGWEAVVAGTAWPWAAAAVDRCRRRRQPVS